MIEINITHYATDIQKKLFLKIDQKLYKKYIKNNKIRNKYLEPTIKLLMGITQDEIKHKTCKKRNLDIFHLFLIIRTNLGNQKGPIFH